MNPVIIVDFEAFKKETGLEDELLKEIYQVFLEELLEEKDKLNVQLAVKDFFKLGKTVHNIKGISGSYHAQQVFNTAKELDELIKEDRTGEIHIMVTGLIDCISAAEIEIRRYLGL